MSTGTGGGTITFGKRVEIKFPSAYTVGSLFLVGASFLVSYFLFTSDSSKNGVVKYQKELSDYFTCADSVLSNTEEFKMKDFIGVGDSASTYQITPREYLGAYWKMLKEKKEVTDGKHYLNRNK